MASRPPIVPPNSGTSLNRTLAGVWDAEGRPIVNLGAPLDQADAATKAYVDGVAGGGGAIGTWVAEAVNPADYYAANFPAGATWVLNNPASVYRHHAVLGETMLMYFYVTNTLVSLNPFTLIIRLPAGLQANDLSPYDSFGYTDGAEYGGMGYAYAWGRELYLCKNNDDPWVGNASMWGVIPVALGAPGKVNRRLDVRLGRHESR